MTLDDYIETYKDMLTDALYFKKIGIKENIKNIVEITDRIGKLYEEAIVVDNIEDAETYYNELRSELFECEEILDEVGYEGEED